jgi:glycosyltransferase involved in cell wall biosynthesis
MKFSIITVAYNSAKTIEQTLQSVTEQTYKDIEHIVIDGQSTDATLAIVKKYPQLRVVSEPDKGIYDAMNKGIALATGDIIGILNADDVYYDRTILEHVARAFVSTSTASVYGDLVYVAQDNTETIIRHWRSGQYRFGLFRQGWMPPHPTFFVRKEIYAQYGDFDLRLPLAADYEIMLRLLEKKNISTLYIPYTFVRMRIGGASNKNIRNLLQNYHENVLAWKYNALRPAWYTLILKRVSKIAQFLVKQ